MSLPRPIALATLCTALPLALAAQSTPKTHRLALGLALDAETVPDAFSSRCGHQNSGSAGWGVQASAVARPRGVLVVQADVHALVSSMSMGCDLVGYSVSVGPGVREMLAFPTFRAGTPLGRYVTTTLRAGVETPRGMPLLRAMVGAGAIWGGRSLPLGVAALAVGTREVGTRWFAEFQYAVSRTAATEARSQYATTARGDSLIGVRTVHRTLHPRWSTVRVGIELPVGR